MKLINLRVPAAITDERKHAAMIAASMCATHGHDWKFDGGRSCPVGDMDCSEPVEICKRCGVHSSLVYAVHPYCTECDRGELQEKEEDFSIDDWNNNLDPFVRFALKSIFYGW